MGDGTNINKKILIIAIVLIILITPLAIITAGGGRRSIWDLMSGSENEKTAEADTDETEIPEPEPVEDGVVRLASDQDLGNLDVAKNSDTYYLAINVFDRLVEIEETADGTPEIVPSLATEWSASDDGKEYTFTLRDDVTFSNGKPLTAEDVKFSLTRLLTVPDSEQVAYADMIAGADELMNGKADELTGIQVMDDTHLKIRLNEPFPSFISMLGSPACSILSKDVVTAAGDSYGEEIDSIVGSGPYMLTQNSEEMSTMELNPLYWGETPSVKKAEMRVMVHAVMNREFGLGHLDMLDLDYMSGEARKYYLEYDEFKSRLIVMKNVGIISLMLNTAMPPLDDLRVRKAVQYAIDRERIIEEVCGGYADTTDGIFPEGLIGYAPENQGWMKYDPEEAKRLLKEAGIGSDYTIELAYGATADLSIQKLTEIVQENLNAVGLNAVTVVYDSDSRLYLRRNGKIMAYVFDWLADYNDPDNFIYTIFGSADTTQKFSSNYKDLTTIARIGNARTIVDDEKRLKEYASLEKKLVETDAVWVPLYSADHVLVKGSRVKGYTPYWAGWSDAILKNIELE